MSRLKNFFTPSSRRTIAYVVVTLAFFVGLNTSLNRSDAISNRLDQRVEYRNYTNEVVVKAFGEVCLDIRANADAKIDNFNTQIAFTKRSNEPPPPSIEERVAILKEQRERIVVPDCDSRSKELLEKIVGGPDDYK